MQRSEFDYCVASDIVYYNWVDNETVTVVTKFQGTGISKVS